VIDRLREEWRATGTVGKVILTIVGILFLTYGSYMILFGLRYRF
jgi:hypothetical protein